MKKTLIASAVSLAVLATAEANASISITGMNFDVTYAATGSINDDGTLGAIESIDPFHAIPWSATQETTVINSSNGVTWAGTNALGSWDYTADIANMAENQVAVGVLWNWNTSNDVAVLAVFDCSSGTACIGQSVGADGNKFGGMQTGPFPTEILSYNGTGTLSAVPVPAAAWLFGSGLIGLIGLARRKAYPRVATDKFE